MIGHITVKPEPAEPPVRDLNTHRETFFTLPEVIAHPL